jgi:hypothetical protein
MSKESAKKTSSLSPASGIHITILLSPATLEWIDEIRVKLGCRSRAIIIEQLLLELCEQNQNSKPVKNRSLLELRFAFLHFLRGLKIFLFPCK